MREIRYRLLVELPTAESRWFVVEEPIDEATAADEMEALRANGAFVELVDDT